MTSPSSNIRIEWESFSSLKKWVEDNSSQSIIASVRSGDMSTNAYWGMTSLLDEMILRNDLDAVDALVQLGADLRGNLELQISAAIHLCSENPEMLSLLLEHGADVNDRDTVNHGSTCLLQSFSYLNARTEHTRKAKRIRCIEIGLQHGADPLECNDYGATPLQMAQASGLWDELEHLFAGRASQPTRPFPVSRCFPKSKLSDSKADATKTITDSAGEFLRSGILDAARVSIGNKLILNATTVKGVPLEIATAIHVSSHVPNGLIVSPATQAFAFESNKTWSSLEKKVTKAGQKPSPRWIKRLEQLVDGFDFDQYPVLATESPIRDAQPMQAFQSVAPWLMLQADGHPTSLLLANVPSFGTGGCSGAKLIHLFDSIETTGDLSNPISVVAWLETGALIHQHRLATTNEHAKALLKAIIQSECQFAYRIDECSSPSKTRELASVFRTIIRSQYLFLTWQ